MYCIHCGKEIPDESQFCGYCGKAVPRPSVNSTPQETVPSPHVEEEKPLPIDSEPIRDTPIQTYEAAEAGESSQKDPEHKKKVVALAVLAVLALVITVFGVLDIVGGTGAKQVVRQVQNGYLGGYDDVTINEMLTYLLEGFEVTWDGWASDDEAYLVEVRISDGENAENDDVIQFKADNEGLFRLSGIKASDLDASNTAEVMQYLNQLYYQYYLFKAMEDDIDADATKIMNQMSNIPVGIVMYGTPADYKGNRLNSCMDRASEVEKKYTVGEILWGIVPDSSIADNSSFGGGTQTDAYDNIIALYATALREGWGYDQLEAAGLNYMCMYYTDPSEIGYAIVDVNHNGSDELIIGAVGEYGGGSGEFFDLYTMVDGQVTLVASSGERDRYYLYSGGYLDNEGSDGADYSYNIYYQFYPEGYILMEEALVYDDEFVADGSWSYGAASTLPEERVYITNEEALQIMNRYQRVGIGYTPFT